MVSQLMVEIRHHGRIYLRLPRVPLSVDHLKLPPSPKARRLARACMWSRCRTCEPSAAASHVTAALCRGLPHSAANFEELGAAPPRAGRRLFASDCAGAESHQGGFAPGITAYMAQSVSRRATMKGLAAAAAYGPADGTQSCPTPKDGEGPVFSPSGPDAERYGSSAETVGASGVYRGLVLSLSRPGWWICGQRKRVAHNPTAATSAEAEISSATTAGIFTPHRG